VRFEDGKLESRNEDVCIHMWASRVVWFDGLAANRAVPG
jgi:hypothetical protein